MGDDRTFIQAANPLVATCAEIEPHLEDFWVTPDSLAGISIVLINAHLKSCERCQQKFVEISSTKTPPWKK